MRYFHRRVAANNLNRLDDGFVKNQQIGSTQFHKTGEEYLKSTIEANENVMALFAGLENSNIRNLFMDSDLEHHFATQAINYRPVLHLTSYANFATTRRWLNNGEMSLMPHEDGAQLHFAAQDNFEVSRSENVIASNICLSNDDEGGELIVWNVKPDAELRREFGVEKTGYPYPIEFVDQFEKISVKLNTGDMYFLNASYIHGVTSSAHYERITSGRFLSKVDNKVVYWTWWNNLLPSH